MSYQDRRPGLGAEGRPPVGASARQARWSWVIAAALVVALGLLFYGINSRENGQRAANPAAITAFPAPAAGVSPPAPQTTTGQPTPPPAASETTGQGGPSAPPSR
jgi:hypothetical protein